MHAGRIYLIDIFDRISQKMIAQEVTNLKSVPSHKGQMATELAKSKSAQAGLMQQIQDRHAQGRPRLANLDDQLGGLEVTREQLALELAATEAPTEDFRDRSARLKQRFKSGHC